MNDVGLSRKHVIEGVLASLNRLQLDYADIVFAHRYETSVRLFERWLTFASSQRDSDGLHPIACAVRRAAAPPSPSKSAPNPSVFSAFNVACGRDGIHLHVCCLIFTCMLTVIQ